MKRLLKVTLIVAMFALALLPHGIHAQSDRLYMVHIEQADPSQLTTYEATSKEFLGLIAKYGITSIPFDGFKVLMLDDLSFSFVSPLDSLGDLTKVYESFGALAQKMGPDNFAAFMKRANAPIAWWRDTVIKERGDLAFTPSRPRVKEAEVGAIRFDYYYVKPGREFEVAALAKEWNAMLTRRGIADGYTVYESLFGSDGPLFVVATPGKSAADLAAANEANRRAAGEAWTSLERRTLELCRRFETKIGYPRPDLSYPQR